MKAIKRLLFAALIIMPTFLPTQTKANGLIDFITGLFDNNDKDKKDHPKGGDDDHNGNNGNCNPGTGNSVPIDGGIVFLFAAGLGLGVKMIYDVNKRKALENNTI